MLSRRAAEQPDRLAFTVLGAAPGADAEGASAATWAELERAVLQLAGRLEELGVGRAPIVLAYPTSLAFVVAFLACLRVGASAVPTPFPVRPGDARRLHAIVRDVGASIVLTTGTCATHAFADTGATVVTTDAEVGATGEDGPAGAGRADNRAALLQYTSGSTSTPKGVVVSHRNLVHNQQLIERAFGHGPQTVIVSWLPTFHDMGLACVLQAVHAGGHTVLMPPEAFLSDPARWLQAISHFRGTTSGGPDFGYALCAARVTEEQRAGLDLTCWRVAFNGSEPIRAATLRRFADVFAGAGFDERSFAPCYGLAEATLLVSARRPGSPPTTHDGVVSCGPPAGQRVAIAGPAGTELPAGAVGEIWVAGASVARGYRGRPEASRETFEARLAGAPGERFLRTGDLGFMTDGELHVTGRLKDLIIVRGANHYPQDVERTAEDAAPEVRRGRCAAFAVDGAASEAVVVVAELRRAGHDLAEVAEAIRQAVAQEHGLALDGVVLAEPGAVPVTTSGKVRRGACRTAYLEGALRAPYGWRRRAAEHDVSASSIAAFVSAWVARATGAPSGAVDLETPAAAHLDSLAATGLAQALEEGWDVPVGAADVLACESLAALAARLEAARGTARSPYAAPPPDVANGFPLSNAQRGIWFLHGLDPGGGAWTIARRFRVHGRCEPAELAAAFRRLVHRHAALRTCVVMAGGRPLQVVREHVEEPLRVHHRAAPPPRERPPAPDLERGPLLGADLYVTAGADAVLDVRVHHLAVDFASFGTILEDLDAILAGRALGAEAADLGFARHAIAHADGAGSGAGDSAAFWEQALHGASAALDLPSCSGRRGHAGTAASQPIAVGAQTHRRLIAIARAAGATPYVVYLAAFLALLHRLTGREDVVVGSPVSVRDEAGLRGVVGCLMNPVAIRSDAAGDPPFAEFLGRVRATVLGALRHAEYPLDLLASLLGARGGPSPSLFGATLIWQRSQPGGRDAAAIALGLRGATTTVGGGTWELLDGDRHAARSDLELALGHAGGTVAGVLTYDSDRFTAAAMGDAAEQLETLLASIAGDPAQRLSELSVTSPPQARRIASWQGRLDAAADERATLDELFDRRAGAYADAPAILWKDEAVAYGELQAAADGVAATLRASGVAPGARVAVLMRDAPATVAALLGVLKSGAAFACPSLRAPPPWLADVLRELAPAALLVDDRGRDAVEAAIGAGFAHRPGIVPPSGRDARAPAFVAYTSGSTGRPKGVVQSHRSFAQFLGWQSRRFGVGPGTRWAHWSALNYDAAYCEILGSLCFGATLVMAPEEERRDPAAFSAVIDRSRATLLQTVPSYLRQLLRAGAGPRLRSLEQVMVAGEPLPLELAAAWRAAQPTAPLFNLYGPTESVLATWHRVAAEDGAHGAAAPLGRPIDGRQIWVLDAHGRPAPIGGVGEVHIASSRLADGYLASPSQTAAAFVPADAGSRMYRTGDLASWSSEGALRFHGRRDGQMKVRGSRVEAAEVEAALQRHPEVVECAVVGRSDAVDGTRIEAHVVVSQPVSEREMRAHLASLLPPHMVPARFAFPPGLPRTLTGKVARRALPPAPAPAPRGDRGARTASEHLVAELWSDVLGLDRVDVDAAFFDVGGSSLAAMQLANRMSAVWAVDVPVATVFEASTVRDQAAAIDRAAAAGETPSRWEAALAEVERLSDAEARDALAKVALP